MAVRVAHDECSGSRAGKWLRFGKCNSGIVPENVRSGGMFRLALAEVLADQVRAGFDEFLFWFTKCAHEIAFDVEFGGELVLHEDGDYDLALHHGGSGEVAGIFGNVVHDDGLSTGSGCATEARIEGNAGVGREAADEWAHEQDVGVGVADEIEADPVVTG